MFRHSNIVWKMHYTIPFQTHKHLDHRMTELCANFYISSNIFTLSTLSQLFLQKLLTTDFIEMTVAEGSCL